MRSMAEIDKATGVIGGQAHILGLDVAVYEPALVDVFERTDNLEGKHQRAHLGHAAVRLNDLKQIAIGHVLLNQRVSVRHLRRVVERGNVRVLRDAGVHAADDVVEGERDLVFIIPDFDLIRNCASKWAEMPNRLKIIQFLLVDTHGMKKNAWLYATITSSARAILHNAPQAFPTETLQISKCTPDFLKHFPLAHLALLDGLEGHLGFCDGVNRERDGRGGAKADTLHRDIALAKRERRWRSRVCVGVQAWQHVYWWAHQEHVVGRFTHLRVFLLTILQ